MLQFYIAGLTNMHLVVQVQPESYASMQPDPVCPEPNHVKEQALSS